MRSNCTYSRVTTTRTRSNTALFTLTDHSSYSSYTIVSHAPYLARDPIPTISMKNECGLFHLCVVLCLFVFSQFTVCMDETFFPRVSTGLTDCNGASEYPSWLEDEQNKQQYPFSL